MNWIELEADTFRDGSTRKLHHARVSSGWLVTETYYNEDGGVQAIAMCFVPGGTWEPPKDEMLVRDPTTRT